jgi:hypothetical protein
MNRPGRSAASIVRSRGSRRERVLRVFSAMGLVPERNCTRMSTAGRGSPRAALLESWWARRQVDVRASLSVTTLQSRRRRDRSEVAKVCDDREARAMVRRR